MPSTAVATGMDTLRREARLQWDNSDPWGSAIGMAFDVCNTLVCLGEWVPSECEYRPAAAMGREWLTVGKDSGEADAARDLYYGVLRGYFDADQLRYAARVLCRLTDVAEAAGHSY